MHKDNKRQLNNRGFSLIELLVAVAILAVIITPFLMAFVTSAWVNKGTKTSQNAKFAATNVMEDIRSVDASGVINAGETEAKKQELDANGYYTFSSGGIEYRVTPKDDGSYICTTTYEVDQVDKAPVQFTIDAIIDPNGNESVTEMNQVEMAHIKAMSTANDAFYQIGGATDDGKLDELAEHSFGNRNETILKQIYDTVNRVITVRISPDGNGSKVSVGAKYTTPTDLTGVQIAESEIYSNESGDVQNIYLFYNPLYNGNSRQATETINVINEKGCKCDVFLIKQDWPIGYNVFSYSRFNTRTAIERNNRYKLDVRLSQNWTESDYGSEGTLTVIRSDVEKDKILPLYCPTANGSAFSNKVGNYTAADVMGLTNLAGTAKSDHVYKVTVNAYEGILEGNDRDESQIKCTLSATTK